jgi:hypothetical protein
VALPPFGYLRGCLVYNIIEKIIDFASFVAYCLVLLTGLALAGIVGLTIFLFISGGCSLPPDKLAPLRLNQINGGSDD